LAEEEQSVGEDRATQLSVTATAAPETIEEPPVEIHKPKPWHNWREFLKEYAIIVLGVATALAAEQIAEKLHDRAKAAEARASIRAEISRNLGTMDWRDATEACMAKRLDETDGLIADLAAGRLPQEALWIGTPIGNGMDTGRYETGVQSGATSLFGSEEQAAYASLYANFKTYQESIVREHLAWADMRSLEKHPSPSAALDVMLRGAVQAARINRWGIQASRLVAIRVAAGMGIAPAKMGRLKMPDACVPLHTTREAALKLLMQPDEWNLEPPK